VVESSGLVGRSPEGCTTLFGKNTFFAKEVQAWHSISMTITLPAEQDSLVARLVSLGRFKSPQEAVTEAVKRLAAEETQNWLNPMPLTDEEAASVYAVDADWEAVEKAAAGRARPEV
jgi:Arc/MetJ-type ribon-helix-helix transcriptional regulator